MANVEIITDGGRGRRWSAAEKLRIVEETLEDHASIPIVARRTGVAPNPLYRWRRLRLEGGTSCLGRTGRGRSRPTSARSARPLDLPGFCGERLAQFPALSLEGDGALEAER